MTSSTDITAAMRLPDRPCDHCGDRAETGDFYSAAVGEFRACGQPCADAYVRDRTDAGRARRQRIARLSPAVRDVDHLAHDYGLAVAALHRALGETVAAKRRAERAMEEEKAALRALREHAGDWQDDPAAWDAYTTGKGRAVGLRGGSADPDYDPRKDDR